VALAACAGSLRAASVNAGILRFVQSISAKHGVDFETLSIRELPLFNQDLEAALPEPVVAFRTAIERADGILFVTEECNYSVSGTLKNAIDWASRSYGGRPSYVAVLSCVSRRYG
jgi:chromate reductase